MPARAAQQYAQALNLMRSGRNGDAELEFKELALAYPEFAGPHVNLGLLYMRESRYSEAEGAFKAALERNPNNAVAENELGIAERKLGKFTEAEAAYQRTIAIDPNYAPAYLNLGVLYDLYLAEPQKALEQFEHYLALAGENKKVAGWVIELRKRVGAAGARRTEGACMTVTTKGFKWMILAAATGAAAVRTRLSSAAVVADAGPSGSGRATRRFHAGVAAGATRQPSHDARPKRPRRLRPRRGAGAGSRSPHQRSGCKIRPPSIDSNWARQL